MYNLPYVLHGLKVIKLIELKGKYKSFKRHIKKCLNFMHYMIIKLFSKSQVLSSLYYILNPRFGREHQAVLIGKLNYFKNLNKPNGSISLLRRNIHRLEKGLIMQPRRVPFALSYIEETYNTYLMSLRSMSVESNELLWANDVLTEYFKVCDQNFDFAKDFDLTRSLIKEAFEHEDFEPFNPNKTPYLKNKFARSTISYDSYKDLCIQRRSTRWFKSQVPDIELIDRAIECARLSPTACNRLPYKFLVFNKPEEASFVASLAGGTKGFSQQIPCIIVVVGDLSNYFHERDRHLIYIDGSLAAMNFMQAAETLGLSTCPINWSDVERQEANFYKAIPSLGLDERPIMFIAVGFASENCLIPYSSRKEITQLRILNPELVI